MSEKAHAPIEFTGIINEFEADGYTGHVVFEERHVSIWDARMSCYTAAIPESWSVTLGNVKENAWRSVLIPVKRCKGMEQAVRLAMKLLPLDQITMHGPANDRRHGKTFVLVKSKLVDYPIYK